MAQSTKIIDVTKSYIPIDPKAFPETYHLANKEDFPTDSKQVRFYEGHNFLPTPHGYKSYFGTAGKLDAPAVPYKIDRIFIFQRADFSNAAIALTEGGIYIITNGNWTTAVSLDTPPSGTYLPWTYAVIGNRLFCYRQGEDRFFVYSNEPELPTEGEIAGALPTVINPAVPHPANTFYSIKPTFLNMAGQIGLFKAGSRLGFWDSANSIGWSSIDDFADFKPSVTSLAGNTLFQEVTGKIVQVLPSGKGFVIYATKSITHISADSSQNNSWLPTVLMKNSGIAYIKECCHSAMDEEQYAYTSTGMFAIQGNTGKFVIPEVVDYLKESKQPVYLSILQGRYLFLEILDETYLNSNVTFTTTELPAVEYTFPIASALIEEIEDDSSDMHQLNAQALYDRVGTVPKGEGETFVPLRGYYLNDAKIVQPLDEGLPVISALQLTKEELGTINSDYVDYYETTFPSADPVFFSIGGQYRAVEYDYLLDYTSTPYESSGVYYCNVISTARAAKEFPAIQPALGKLNVAGGDDNSHELTEIEIAALPVGGFAQLQEETWEARDTEVAALISYLAAYSTENIHFIQKRPIAYPLSFGFAGYPPQDINNLLPYPYFDGEYEPSYLLNGVSVDSVYVNYPSDPRIIGSVNHVVNNLAMTIPSSGVTIDSGWTPIAVSKTDEFGSLRYYRERGFVTGVNPRLTLDYEDVVLDTSDSGATLRYDGGQGTMPEDKDGCRTYPTKLAYRAHKHSVSIVTSALSTEDIDNPVQEGFADMLGYSYLDSEGNTQYIRYTDPLAGGITQPNPIPPLSFPPSSFTLQDGNQSPAYPTIPGALVFDTYLIKWGRMQVPYQTLIDFSPVNVTESAISYSTFGIEAGVVTEDRDIYIFDKNPIDSYIKLGKIGYYRQGMTKAEEVRIHFRSPSTGIVSVEGSLNGATVETGLNSLQTFTDAMFVTVYLSMTGRWFNIAISGNYDIKHVEFRGSPVGNR